LSIGGYIAESDHKLIGQIRARLVGGIRAESDGLVKLNHQPLRFRLLIPDL